jgi:GxxExxY protein
VENELNQLSEQVIAAAIAVHKELGPGLLESTYEACLAHELLSRGIEVERQKSVPVIYRGIQIDCGYRLDLLVNRTVIVELKAVERIDNIHEAQILSYLRLSGFKLGLLINFNVRFLKDGIRRFINGFD